MEGHAGLPRAKRGEVDGFGGRADRGGSLYHGVERCAMVGLGGVTVCM